MNTMTSLRDASTEQLASIYDTGTDADRAAVLAEMKRQDRNAARRARYAAYRAEWECWAYAQYLQAEAECRGNLVARESSVTDGWALWSGSEAHAMKHASEELRNFWLANPRVTVTEYIAQVTRDNRIQAEEYREARAQAKYAAQAERAERRAAKVVQITTARAKVTRTKVTYTERIAA